MGVGRDLLLSSSLLCGSRAGEYIFGPFGPQRSGGRRFGRLLSQVNDFRRIRGDSRGLRLGMEQWTELDGIRDEFGFDLDRVETRGEGVWLDGLGAE